VDDPAARPARQFAEQVFHQYHMPELVDHEDLLNAVDQAEVGKAASTGIQDQDIETCAQACRAQELATKHGESPQVVCGSIGGRLGGVKGWGTFPVGRPEGIAPEYAMAICAGALCR